LNALASLLAFVARIVGRAGTSMAGSTWLGAFPLILGVICPVKRQNEGPRDKHAL
jgi:hypothetical protein